jgi:arsenite-transporting ATPase
MTRVVLVSGKGGVGKTTIAAATAVRAAELGHRALVVSLDRAHNLGDVLGAKLTGEPLPVEGVPGLDAFEADPQAELRRSWRALSAYFARLLAWAGLGGAEADEVAVVPGLEELLILTRLTEIVESEASDIVVVDLAPTASSLRLLSFPELMAGPIGRFARWERSFLKLMRPAVRRATRAPIPDEELYDAIDTIAARLGRLRAILTDPERACVRLVGIPERVVLEETRAAFTLLSLFGLCVDAVVLNRVLPEEAGAGYFGRWAAIQAREIARAKEQFASAPVLELRFMPDEVMGPAALRDAARELYGDRDPALAFVERAPVRYRDEAEGTVLELWLPHADGRGLDLKQRDDELIVSARGWRRQLPLPASLRGRAVRSARFRDGALRVLFERSKEKEQHR